MKIKRQCFTLVEILAALTILATAVTATMYVLSSSAWRIRRAELARGKSHQLANAVEFFMLNPPGTQIDKKFFPHDDIKVSARYETPELQEGFEVEINQQKLTTMVVELTDSSGEIVDFIKMNRIVEAKNK